MQRHCYDILFICSVLVLGFLYASYPQRSAQWDSAWEGWKTLLYSEVETEVDVEEHLLAKLNYAETQYEALAYFDELEYLGCIYSACDGNIMTGSFPKHCIVTYWRSSFDSIQDFSVHARLVDFEFRTVAEIKSELFWENNWAWAILPLGQFSVDRGQIWIELSSTQLNKIPVTSTILITSQDSELLIWER